MRNVTSNVSVRLCLHCMTTGRDHDQLLVVKVRASDDKLVNGNGYRSIKSL